MEALLKNPYVKSPSSKAITCTEEFKDYYVSEYETGKPPSEILRNSGFDLSALGRRRHGICGQVVIQIKAIYYSKVYCVNAANYETIVR